MFRVCSASDEIYSGYAHHILNDDFEMVLIYRNAEHARKLVTRSLSMRENWFPLAEHA
jgi:hypothetical protein